MAEPSSGVWRGRVCSADSTGVCCGHGRRAAAFDNGQRTAGGHGQRQQPQAQPQTDVSEPYDGGCAAPVAADGGRAPSDGASLAGGLRGCLHLPNGAQATLFTAVCRRMCDDSDRQAVEQVLAKIRRLSAQHYEELEEKAHQRRRLLRSQGCAKDLVSVLKECLLQQVR